MHTAKSYLLILLLLFISCNSSSGIYRLGNNTETVAVAISTERLISVIHPLHLHQQFRLYVRGAWVLVEIINIGPHGIVELRGVNGPLDLQRGDSGSPVMLLVGKKYRATAK